MRKREKPYAIEVKLNAACNKGSGSICWRGYRGAGEIKSGEASEKEKGER